MLGGGCRTPGLQVRRQRLVRQGQQREPPVPSPVHGQAQHLSLRPAGALHRLADLGQAPARRRARALRREQGGGGPAPRGRLRELEEDVRGKVQPYPGRRGPRPRPLRKERSRRLHRHAQDGAAGEEGQQILPPQSARRGGAHPAGGAVLWPATGARPGQIFVAPCALAALPGHPGHGGRRRAGLRRAHGGLGEPDVGQDLCR
mmetsp:Transcript_99754/g.310725  ORF Transcript_99754/g.310725 Transcript_99754/m.310725 type:complete len:203 (+) Transcript_99754:367-975(+)